MVDDEPLAMELMASYVRKVPYLELIGSFDNSIEAVSAIGDSDPDLLFLDIQMPELNGIELARIIAEKNIMVIFVTAFQQYALEGFRVNALDYLLKPVSFAEFITAAEKAKKYFDMARRSESLSAHEEISSNEKNNQSSIFVKTDYKLVRINFSDILYIEGLKDYVKIYLDDEPHPVISRMSMKSIEEALPTKDFIRVHRSFIVQKDKLQVI